MSGDKKTEVKEVRRRPPESKGDLRTSRCTPVSVRSQPKAYSPLICTVALLIPATSPPDTSISSVVNPLLSAQRKYIRNSISAQSRSEEHTSELQSRGHLVCRLLLEKKKNRTISDHAPGKRCVCQYVNN